MKNMYRVSSELRPRLITEGKFTRHGVEQEQCGVFYYFNSIENACVLAEEMGTGIDVIRYNEYQPKQDSPAEKRVSKVGDYVDYEGTPWLVVDVRNELRLIMQATKKAPTVVKLQVSESKLSNVRDLGALTCWFVGKEYLVTTKGLIVSLTTHKRMNWTAGDHHHKGIMEMVELRRAIMQAA